MKKKLTSLCCVILALLLCAPAAFAQAAPQTTPEQELTEDDIREGMELSGEYEMQEYDSEDLHFYELRKKNTTEDSPILFLLHPATSRKEEMVYLAMTFLDAGYVVVAPDLPGHGESISDEPLDMIDVIQQAAHNIDVIRSMYENIIYADPDDFALLGVSLGALTSLYYAAYSETKPQCVVSYYGTPVWNSLLSIANVYYYRQNGQSAPMATKEERVQMREELTENSPDQNIEELLSVPLLLVNSDTDDIIPIEGVTDFQERAADYPNQLTVVVREGAEHASIGEANGPETLAFLQEHMPSGIAQFIR